MICCRIIKSVSVFLGISGSYSLSYPVLHSIWLHISAVLAHPCASRHRDSCPMADPS